MREIEARGPLGSDMELRVQSSFLFPPPPSQFSPQQLALAKEKVKKIFNLLALQIFLAIGAQTPALLTDVEKAGTH